MKRAFSRIFFGIIAINVFALIILSGCSTDSAKPSDLNYFPLRVGQYWIYDVEETSTLRTACADNGDTSLAYELKVIVADSFPNTEKGFTYVLQRLKRANVQATWTPFETWSAQVKNNQVLVNESNVIYVKLINPLVDGLIWNGNLYNNEVELNNLNVDNYTILNKGKSYTTSSGQNFANTVTVNQNDEDSNILYRDTRSEIYAFGVGLVYKESYLLKYFANSQLSCYGQKRTQQGTTLKQSLKEFKSR